MVNYLDFCNTLCIYIRLLISFIPYKLSYIEGLKGNAEFKATLPNPDVKFKYSSASDSNLILIRKKYNLDSVAGKGTETEQIINLILWVHGLS